MSVVMPVDDLRLHQYGEAGSVGIVTTRVKINSLDKSGGPPVCGSLPDASWSIHL